MADINFIETYVPDYAELGQTDLYATRERLVNFMRVKFADIDLTPNTVVGDLIVTPQTYTVTALETGLERLLSDLNLANLAEDKVYDCATAKTWISNFINTEQLNLKPSGVLRLTFSKNKSMALDRSTQFTFNDTDIFTMYLPNLGNFVIYRVGEPVPAGINGATLIDTGSGLYYCDVPVIGETGALADVMTDVTSTGEVTYHNEAAREVTAGTTCSINTVLENLESAAALADFDPGYKSFTIPKLAQYTRNSMYAASLNTRTGAMRFTELLCPFTESVYAICSGDKEMLRTYHNAYGVSTGAMDLYVRSKGYEFTEEQTVRLYLTADRQSFAGPWNYSGQPYHIESITNTTTPDVLNIPNVTITSTNTMGLGALAAYTAYEQLEISVPAATEATGDFVYATNVDNSGRVYAEFVVRYQTDPTYRAIAQTIENPDNRAVNTSVLVRGFIPIIIDKFEVVYVREPGVVPVLPEALDKIKAYMGGLGAPYVFSEAEIARIMDEAGVKYTKGINVKARVQWSVANKIMNYDGAIVDVPAYPSIISSEGLRIQYPAPAVQLTADDMFACSVRNVRYYLMENSVTFKEVKDI